MHPGGGHVLSVALTGGIACGKSTAANLLARRGLPVCDADDLARAAMRRGGAAYGDVVRAFGAGVLGPDGEIDRRALGALVFADARRREVLNGLVHPCVGRAWAAWLASERERGSPAAAVVIPLLFEVGEGRGWNLVVSVVAPEAVQARRLRERGFAQDEAAMRIAAQWPWWRKMDGADHVVFNACSMAVLERQMERVWSHIAEMSHGRQKRQGRRLEQSRQSR